MSLELARARARRISHLEYDLSLTLPEQRRDQIRGRMTITFDAVGAGQPLAIDFAQPPDHLLDVSANSRAVEPRLDNGHIMIPPAAVTAGRNTIAIGFIAGDGPLNRNDEFLYSLFVPARASLTLPCFDQPDLKGRWQLALDLPGDWVAVSNARENGRVVSGARAHLIFERTEPIPTYLFAFAAGKFQVETATRDGRTLRLFHRETDAAHVTRNRDAIFDLHGRALSWLEDYTAIRYPFGKFDAILIPSFQFGGMEHPGAIYYNASSLLLDEAATQNQELGRANLIAHETSHMWFGDLVTMAWFNDVWMKEVFANFMAAKVVSPWFPIVNHDLRFLLDNYPAAYDVDRTDGANPIRQDLANLNEAGTLYGAIIYQKAPIVMRQLELLVGADGLREGLRQYLHAHRFGNASWTDLLEILAPRTPTDLSAWSHAWVAEAGRPTISTELEVRNGRIARLSFRQSDRRGRGLLWPQRVTILVHSERETRRFEVTLEGLDTEVAAAVGLPDPDWVLPTGGGLGYGLFDLDPVTLQFLTHSLDEIADPLTRGAALVARWEAMLEGRVAAALVLGQLALELPREADELNLQEMLKETRVAFWRLTPAADRLGVATTLEPVLLAGLERASSTSARAAWFGAIRSVATTASTLVWLEHVWRHEVSIPGLPLAETDDAELAAALAIRNVATADDILATQLARFTNPDRRDRFQFVMPSLSRDAAVRDRFFDSLRDVANRRHESWVLAGMQYLNHPRREATSAKHVLPALELVREIQQTGDIFFPKRWADAALGGTQSRHTAAAVRRVIAALPATDPPRLRWVLLSSADQ
ncbi:MAG: M1 family aminopeptidase, partial [Acidobacteriota bacterium]